MINDKIYKTNKLLEFKKYFNFLESIQENIDYKLVLPNHLKDKYEKIILETKKEIDTLDEEFLFVEKATKYNRLESLLKPCKIDLTVYRIFLNKEKNESLKKTLRTFKSINSYTENINYDYFNNTTGRLVVKNGPSILTLPKKYRSIMTSRFNKGKIVSLDFTSLEPRFCLKILEKDTENDLYEEFNKKLDLNLDRSIIKRAIISVLYGSHHTSLREISASKAKVIFESIRDYFELNKLLEFSTNIDKKGIRRNYEGRPLWNLDEEKENILINNYIQSSAVDVALGFFCKLVDFVDQEKAVPLFILHDAIIFDVSEDYFKEFEEISKKGYTHKNLGNFPLKLEIFNKKFEES